MKSLYKFSKRIFDIIFSSTCIIVFFPFFFLIGLAIKFTSKGPVFFRQNRVGKDGKIFKIIKFRSMHVSNNDNSLITVKNDDRITKIGKFLRKTKIDEFPQLFNVLIGSMSVVGPRPEVPKFVELYNKKQSKILVIKPGITDYASIEYRHENDYFKSKIGAEEYYIKFII